MFFKQVIVFIAVFTFSASAVLGQEESRCSWLVMSQAEQFEALDAIFSKVFCDSHIYQPDQCHSNVLQLFRQFRRYHPEISPNDFNVLYITTEKWVQDLDASEDGFHVTTARKGYENGESTEYVEMKYHVVVEYRGRIYDLDFTDQPSPVNAEDYLLEFFMSEELIELYDGELRGDMSELLVYVVPGHFYLNLSTEDSSKEQTHVQLMEDNDPQSLVGYLLSVEDL